ncbi:conserved hypothetical protein [Burkholderiales bacterium 8X]|nr:conserved hypothetical protein [Burkholderiales bacterium 8X]
MDKLPLPTDNIYKFYALFGLLLFIFAAGATVALQRGTNDSVYKLYVELESIRATSANPTAATEKKGEPSIREALLERLIEVAKEDKKTLSTYLSVLIAFSILLALAGFYKWHTQIQPIQDEMLRLQLAKLRREEGGQTTRAGFRARSGSPSARRSRVPEAS